MFNQIRDTDNGKTVVTYMIILCSIGVTTITLLFPNLSNVYGIYDNDISFLQWFTLPLAHGFDTLSGLLHLGINIFFFGMIGNFLEKIIGSFRFLLICSVGVAIIGLFGNLISFKDQGLHSITWVLTPLLVYTLNEGRRIKTRSMYEEHYKTLRTILIVMFTIVPITGIFIQFFINPETSLRNAVFHGLIVYAISTALGFLLLPLNRKLIKDNLKFFNRKKRLKQDPNSTAGRYGAFIIPVFLIIVFILGN